MKLTLQLVFGLIILHISPLFPDVIVNEIMSNAPGRESGSGSPGDRMEFIELFNNSISESVDLSGWSFTDGDALDQIEAWQRSPGDTIGSGAVVCCTTLLESGQFALIMDPEYFSPGEGGWYLPGDGALVLTVGNTTLGDGLSSGDPVTLINGVGDSVSTFGTPGWDDGFPDNPGDGISWERIDPAGRDNVSNWTVSAAPSGSTPGSRNSRSIPVDIAIVDSSLVVYPLDPGEGETVTMTATVMNRGLLDTPGLEVWSFLDSDRDGSLEEQEVRFKETILEPISPGDSLPVSSEVHMGSRGFYMVGMAVVHPDDGDETNNLRIKEIRVGSADVRVIINEIFYYPSEGGVEWVEIFNRSDAMLDLSGWSFSDTRTRGLLKGKELHFDSGSYAVLTGDSTALVSILPGLIDGRIIEAHPFPSLNNSGDTLMLETGGGYISERVEYSSAWGGRKGVSLERVSPDDMAAGPSEWGSSVDSDGSTPARENSIYQTAGNHKASFQVRPEILSPDGDGRDDRTLLSYHLRVAKARVRIEIYDLLGNRVRVVLDQVESGSQGVCVWDGRDDSGRGVPVGIYVAYMEAIDPLNGYLERIKRVVILGRQL